MIWMEPSLFAKELLKKGRGGSFGRNRSKAPDRPTKRLGEGNARECEPTTDDMKGADWFAEHHDGASRGQDRQKIHEDCAAAGTELLDAANPQKGQDDRG